MMYGMLPLARNCKRGLTFELEGRSMGTQPVKYQQEVVEKTIMIIICEFQSVILKLIVLTIAGVYTEICITE